MDASLIWLTASPHDVRPEMSLGAGFAAHSSSLLRQWTHGLDHYIVVNGVPDDDTTEQIASAAGLAFRWSTSIEITRSPDESQGVFEAARNPFSGFAGHEPATITAYQAVQFCPLCGGWEGHAGPPCL